MSVYFVTARQVGMVKIGCADDPYERLATLQSASPVELTMEALMVGSFAEERELHTRFAKHRVRGEWFAITDEIDLMIATFPAPVKAKPSWSERVRIRRALQPPKKSPEELAEAALANGREYLSKREKRGDIHFPFRTRSAA